MSTIIYKPEPRYIVETADTISVLGGDRRPGSWDFAFAFHQLDDARAAADRLAEDHEFVRIIDRKQTAA